MKTFSFKKVALSAALLVGASSAFAGAWSVPGTYSGAPGDTVTGITVQFAGDGATVSTQTDIDFDLAVLDLANATLTAGNASTTCTMFDADTVRVVSFSFSPLVAGPETLCTIDIPILGGAALGPTTLTATGQLCAISGGGAAASCTATNGTVTVGAGGTAPTITYAPAPGATVNLPGGAGSIVATPSGGAGAATTTVSGCSIGNVVGPATFGSVAGVNLSFVGPTTTPQNINLTCAQGGTATTADLTCDESGTPRVWPLSCPASGPAGTPPALNYIPAPGSQVSFVGAPGTTINAVIAVNGTGGTGAGPDATARVSDCQVSPALSPPIFACQPSGGNVLDFTPGFDAGDITCSCEAPSTGQVSATLSCEETSPLSTGTPVVRTWNLACPGVPGSCGDLAFSPNPGLIQFAGGAANIGVSHSGGTVGNDTTFNGCSIGGANAANFSISNGPINFAFTGGSMGSNNIALACTNTTAAPVQAILSCTQVCDVNNTPRNWTLECPAGGGPPPVADAVPVPSSSDFSRILLAAMLVLIGMGAVTIRSRS